MGCRKSQRLREAKQLESWGYVSLRNIAIRAHIVIREHSVQDLDTVYMSSLLFNLPNKF